MELEWRHTKSLIRERSRYLLSPIVFVGRIGPQRCDELIERSGNWCFEQGGMEYGDQSLRSTRVAWLEGDKAPDPWWTGQIAEIALAANRHYRFRLTGVGEPLQFCRYEHSGFIDWHLDTGQDEPSTRKLSITIQLTDSEAYEGGDLEFFPTIELGSIRERGTAIVFPSFLVHRITPITRGCRSSLVTWIHGEPFA